MYVCSIFFPARMVSYDEIGGTVLEDIKKHEERQAALAKLTSVVEGDESRVTLSLAQITPPKPKKALRTGRKSKTGVNGHITGSDDGSRVYGSRSSTSSLLSEGSTPTLDIHDRLTQEAIVALELETFTLSTNKKLAQTIEHEDEDGGKVKSCCSVS